MGVRIDGDLDFQDWYYKKYNDVEAVVSSKIYNEYLTYKEQQKIRTILIISILLGVVSVIGQNRVNFIKIKDDLKLEDIE